MPWLYGLTEPCELETTKIDVVGCMQLISRSLHVCGIYRFHSSTALNFEHIALWKNHTLILKHCSVLSMQATVTALLTRLRPTGCDLSWNKSRPVLLPLCDMQHANIHTCKLRQARGTLYTLANWWPAGVYSLRSASEYTRICNFHTKIQKLSSVGSSSQIPLQMKWYVKNFRSFPRCPQTSMVAIGKGRPLLRQSDHSMWPSALTFS